MEIHLFQHAGNTSENGGFSIAMLVYQRVTSYNKHAGKTPDDKPTIGPYHINFRGSMGLVYIPTKMVDFYGKCR